jgi:hypothetical protein
MKEDFNNMNGLVNGRIPKGVQCPFKHKCVFAFHSVNGVVCRRQQAMENNFSCATARLFSLIEREKKNG